MLNQDLIKQFKHIKDGGLTGVLQLQDDGRLIRFYFESGSLLLLDFGQDKELVIADQFVKHHKIDDTMGRYAQSIYNEKQIAIAQTLLKQQLISQGEVDQVTRAMVEDILCYSFSSKLSTSWIGEDDVDTGSFDLNKTAVKIRIDIDMLLTMVQSRVQERDAVQQRIESWDLIYSIEEGATDDTRLNEMEQNVLHFVDGRQSVKDIARSMRESNINIGIYLCSLENQNFIRKGGIRSSTRISVKAITPAAANVVEQKSDAPFADADRAATDAADQHDAADNFKVYTGTQVRKEKSSNLGTVILLIVLLAVAGVAWLVYSQVRAQSRQDQLQADLMTRIHENKWDEAEKIAQEQIDLVGSDVVGKKRIESMLADIRSAYAQNFNEAEKALAEKDLPRLRDILSKFPDRSIDIARLNNLWTRSEIDKLQTLRAEADELQTSSSDLSIQLGESVNNLLRTNNVSLAISRIKNRGEYSERAWAEIIERSQTVLETWRTTTLDDIEVRSKDKSYKWKFQQLESVKLSQPDDAQQQRIQRIESALIAEQQDLLKRLKDIPALLASGDYAAAGAVLVQLEGNAMALPDDKANTVLLLMSQKNDLETSILHNQKWLEKALSESTSDEEIRMALAAVQSDLDAYASLPQRATLQTLVDTADSVLANSAAGTLEEELQGLNAAIAKLSTETASTETPSTAQDAGTQDAAMTQRAAILNKRMQYLTVISKTAVSKMESIRQHAQEGSIDEAIVSLNSFVNNPTYMRTTAMQEARAQLSDYTARKQKNDKIFNEFKQAILEDDVALVSQLLPQLKKQSLPFVVSSVPSGAHIFLNGADTGAVTPALYPATANGERADMKFTLRIDGYHDAEIVPLGTESSWRVRVNMQRKPIAEATLNESIYSAIACIDGAIWLSSNKSVWKIEKDGSAQSFPLESSATTIFAPAMQANGNTYVPTRDRFVVRIDSNGKVTNIPVALASDSAALHYISPVMLDSELLIVTGAENGNIQAVNEVTNTVQWSIVGGSRVATSPILNGDKILVLFQNGECRTYDANNGTEKQGASVGSSIISAWSENGVVYGYTHNALVAWNGSELKVENLLKEIVSGGPDVIKTKDNRIRIPNEEGRFDVELGRLAEEITGQPLLWNGHAVCPVGNKMYILGPRGFTIEAHKPMLAPKVLGDLLIVASSDGVVRLLKQ